MGKYLGTPDGRVNSEEVEANVIGTEYERAGLLPAADAARVRQLLSTYLDQRISFYTALYSRRLHQIDGTSARLQAGIWSIVEAAAAQTRLLSSPQLFTGQTRY